jgi:hypothetical protein
VVVREVKIPHLVGIEHAQILKDKANVEFLSEAIPTNIEGAHSKWTLLFNTDQNGQSYNRFCFHVTLQGPTLGLFVQNYSFETNTIQFFFETRPAMCLEGLLPKVGKISTPVFMEMVPIFFVSLTNARIFQQRVSYSN